MTWASTSLKVTARPPRVSVHHGVSVLPCIVPYARLWLHGAQEHPLFQPCRPPERAPPCRTWSIPRQRRYRNDVLAITSLVPELGDLLQCLLPASEYR